MKLLVNLHPCFRVTSQAYIPNILWFCRMKSIAFDKYYFRGKLWVRMDEQLQIYTVDAIVAVLWRSLNDRYFL